MKKTIFEAIVLMLSTVLAAAAPHPRLEVHEWGTFTTVHASDGTMLSGLEIEEEVLPPFVYSHMGMEPDRLTGAAYIVGRKGYYRPLKNVTVKMETPVLYFYADQAMQARVEVGFIGGSISQWYPQRSSGETVPPGSIDFAQPFTGAIGWDVNILAPQDTQAYTPQPTWQPTHWPIARVLEANKVKGEKGEVEHFLFYRGIGNFEIPLHITADKRNGLQVTNRGEAAIPYLMVYGRLHYGIPQVWWQGPLQPGAAQYVKQPEAPGSGSSLAEVFDTFRPRLVEAGLTEPEASAMLNTWKESYFEREGLRVFWIAPRPFTDAVLPINITPVPEKLERVMVGRSEVLLPEFEDMLAGEYRRNRLAAYAQDRYRRAYAQRAEALSGKAPSIVLTQPAVNDN